MSSPLQLISGVVSDLKIHSGEEEFVRSRGQQIVGVGAAAGLAVEGLAGAAAGAGLAAASAGDAVEFFTCKVGDQLVEGRFSKASFKDGDELSVVTSPHEGRSLVLAARRSQDHLIWMAPHCSRGTKAHASFSRLLASRLVLSFLVAGALFIILMEYSTSPNPFKFIWFDISLIGGITAVASPYFSLRFYRQWLPIARQAEEIFAALGYPDPSRVDLPRDHKRYCKDNGIKWPYLTDGPWIYHYLDPR